MEKNKINVIRNWQDEVCLSKTLQANTDNTNNNLFTFMYLGNVGPVAGVDLLIEAFAKAELPNCRLIIAGSGTMKVPLQKKVKIENLNSVYFWEVPAGKVPEIQSKADIMILPVKKGAAMSSIPSKLPAYMFSAKPIIACVDKGSDSAIAIEHADCGWVLPPEDIAKLSETMKNVTILQKLELAEKGLNGFDFAMENFSKSRNLRKLCAIINEIKSV